MARITLEFGSQQFLLDEVSSAEFWRKHCPGIPLPEDATITTTEDEAFAFAAAQFDQTLLELADQLRSKTTKPIGVTPIGHPLTKAIPAANSPRRTQTLEQARIISKYDAPGHIFFVVEFAGGLFMEILYDKSETNCTGAIIKKDRQIELIEINRQISEVPHEQLDMNQLFTRRSDIFFGSDSAQDTADRNYLDKNIGIVAPETSETQIHNLTEGDVFPDFALTLDYGIRLTQLTGFMPTVDDSVNSYDLRDGTLYSAVQNSNQVFLIVRFPGELWMEYTCHKKKDHLAHFAPIRRGKQIELASLHRELCNPVHSRQQRDKLALERDKIIFAKNEVGQRSDDFNFLQSLITFHTDKFFKIMILALEVGERLSHCSLRIKHNERFFQLTGFSPRAVSPQQFSPEDVIAYIADDRMHAILEETSYGMAAVVLVAQKNQGYGILTFNQDGALVFSYLPPFNQGPNPNQALQDYFSAWLYDGGEQPVLDVRPDDAGHTKLFFFAKDRTTLLGSTEVFLAPFESGQLDTSKSDARAKQAGPQFRAEIMDGKISVVLADPAWCEAYQLPTELQFNYLEAEQGDISQRFSEVLDQHNSIQLHVLGKKIIRAHWQEYEFALLETNEGIFLFMEAKAGRPVLSFVRPGMQDKIRQLMPQMTAAKTEPAFDLIRAEITISLFARTGADRRAAYVQQNTQIKIPDYMALSPAGEARTKFALSLDIAIMKDQKLWDILGYVDRSVLTLNDGKIISLTCRGDEQIYLIVRYPGGLFVEVAFFKIGDDTYRYATYTIKKNKEGPLAALHRQICQWPLKNSKHKQLFQKRKHFVFFSSDQGMQSTGDYVNSKVTYEKGEITVADLQALHRGGPFPHYKIIVRVEPRLITLTGFNLEELTRHADITDASDTIPDLPVPSTPQIMASPLSEPTPEQIQDNEAKAGRMAKLRQALSQLFSIHEKRSRLRISLLPGFKSAKSGSTQWTPIAEQPQAIWFRFSGNGPGTKFGKALKKNSAHSLTVELVFGKTTAHVLRYQLSDSGKDYLLTPQWPMNTLADASHEQLILEDSTLTIPNSTLSIPERTELYRWFQTQALGPDISIVLVNNRLVININQATGTEEESLYEALSNIWAPFNPADMFYINQALGRYLSVDFPEDVTEVIPAIEATRLLYEQSLQARPAIGYTLAGEKPVGRAKRKQPSPPTPEPAELDKKSSMRARTLTAIIHRHEDFSAPLSVSVSLNEEFNDRKRTKVTIAAINFGNQDFPQPDLKVALGTAIDYQDFPLTLSFSHRHKTPRGRESFTIKLYPGTSDGKEIAYSDYQWQASSRNTLTGSDGFTIAAEITTDPGDPTIFLTGCHITMAEPDRGLLNKWTKENPAVPTELRVSHSPSQTWPQEKALQVSFGYKTLFPLNFSILNKGDGTLAVTHLALEYELAVITDDKGKNFLRISTGEQNIDLPLDPNYLNRISHPTKAQTRYLLQQNQLGFLNLLFRWLGAFEAIQTGSDTEVIFNQATGQVTLEAFMRNVDGSLPQRSLGLTPQELAVVETLRLTGTAEFPLQPLDLSGKSHWPFYPDDIFLPTSETLSMLRTQFITQESFMEGQELMYEFENDRGIVLTLPVTWTALRRRNCFRLDVTPDRRMTIHHRGNKSGTLQALPPSFRIHENNGDWTIILVDANHPEGTENTIHFSVSISKHSPALLALVNSRNTKHKAEQELDKWTLAFFRNQLVEVALIQFTSQIISQATPQGPFLLSYSSFDQATKITTTLTGLSLSDDQSQLNFSSELPLTLTHDNGTVVKSLRLQSQNTSNPDVVVLTEIIQKNLFQGPGTKRKTRQFLWSRQSCLLSEVRELPDSTTVAAPTLAEFIGSAKLPTPRPSTPTLTGSNPSVGLPRRRSTEIIAAQNVPTQRITAHSVKFPRAEQIELTATPAEINRLLALHPLHQALFKPHDETMIAQTLAGNSDEIMTFITPDGVFLQILMIYNEEKQRYSMAQADESNRFQIRLLFPTASADKPEITYLQVSLSACRLHKKNSGANGENIELQLVGKSKHDLSFLRVGAKAHNGAYAFGFVAQELGKPIEENILVRARKKIADVVRRLHLHEEPSGVMPFEPGMCFAEIFQSAGNLIVLRGLDEVIQADGHALAYLRYLDKSGNEEKLPLVRSPRHHRIFYLEDEGHDITYYFIVTNKAEFLSWKRPAYLAELYAPTSSVSYPTNMIQAEGEKGRIRYKQSASSIAQRRQLDEPNSKTSKFELLVGINRQGEVLDADLLAEASRNLARLRMNVFIDENDSLQVERGVQLDSEDDAYFPFRDDYEIKIYEDTWQENDETRRCAVTIVFKNTNTPPKDFAIPGKDRSREMFQPYGWVSFENRANLVGDAKNFRVKEAHYHEDNRVGIKLLDERGFLTKRAGVAASLNQTQQAQFARLKQTDLWPALEKTEARQADVPVLMLGLGALNLIGAGTAIDPDLLRSLAVYCALENPAVKKSEILKEPDLNRYKPKRGKAIPRVNSEKQLVPVKSSVSQPPPTQATIQIKSPKFHSFHKGPTQAGIPQKYFPSWVKRSPGGFTLKSFLATRTLR